MIKKLFVIVALLFCASVFFSCVKGNDKLPIGELSSDENDIQWTFFNQDILIAIDVPQGANFNDKFSGSISISRGFEQEHASNTEITVTLTQNGKITVIEKIEKSKTTIVFKGTYAFRENELLNVKALDVSNIKWGKTWNQFSEISEFSLIRYDITVLPNEPPDVQ
ncbi:MAG: hypothetical protein LBO63_01080 [Oscillospiraceae bacterium]|jgi:hypothetical protein|nr:hypothetical protein [Oscillospiraceae bacterium]